MNRMFLITAFVALGLGSVAKADITWTFTNGADRDLNVTSQDFLSGGVTITASSHHDNSNSDGMLYNKVQGPDETGLGLDSDKSGDNEIWNNRYIQLDLSSVTQSDPLSIALQSVQTGEHYQVYTSTAVGGIGDVTGTLGTGVTLFADDQTTESVTGLNRGTSAKFFVAIEVNDEGTNVLLSSLTAKGNNTNPTPEPRFYGLLLVSLLAIPAIRRRFVPQQ